METSQRQTRSSTRRSFPPPETQDKENTKRSKAKRAQSLGGAAAIQFKELVIKPPTDELSPGKRKRRSAVPRKSILKSKAAAEDATQDYTLSAQTAPLPTSMSQDFTTEMNFTTSSMTDERRKSLARRVSFASHAHVRLFPKDAAKLAESSSPSHPSTPSSPDTSTSSVDAASPPPAPSAVEQRPPPPKLLFDLPSPSQDDTTSSPTDRRSGHQRRQSVPDARALLSGPSPEGDSEESSMDIEEDTASMSQLPPAAPLLAVPALEASQRLSMASSIGEDMDVTGVFGDGQPKDDTVEHTASTKSSEAPSEFLVALGKNVPASNPNGRRPSLPSARDKAWQALESVVHGVNDESDEEEDMELMDATGRINAIRRTSVMTTGTTGSSMDIQDEVTGRILETQPRRASMMTEGEDMELDDESDGDDEMNEAEAEKTVDLTAMLSRMAMMQSSSDEVASAVEPTWTEETAERSGSPIIRPTSPRPPKSPSRPQASPRKSFTAAFAPTYGPTIQPLSLKRPASPLPGTPSKRQALGSESNTPRAAQMFASPLRQSPGRVLRRSLGSALGSPMRVVVQSPARGVPVVEEEEREEEEQVTATLPSSRSQPSVPSSQSQSVLEGLEDISGIAQPEDEDDDEIPVRTLTINEFLEMTGVTFMEGLAVKRRSTVGRGVLGSIRTDDGDERRPNRPTAEYVAAAAVGIPQLEMYIWASQELKKNIAAGQETVRQFEEQVEGCNPILFREYLVASEDERPLMEGQLKIMKAHARLSAKEKWYQWRQGIVKDLQSIVTEHLTKLREDHEYIQQTQAELDVSLPMLRERHAALREQLEQERRNILELEGDSPEQLRELKEGISEQNAQIDSFKGELVEIATKTDRLNAKLNDIEEHRLQALAVVKRSEQHCNMLRSCTRSEVFRLKEDYESLQRMHLWKPVKVSQAETILVYDSRVQVQVFGNKHTLGAEGVQLLPPSSGAEDNQISSATNIMFHMMQNRVKSLPANDIQDIVLVVGSAWTAVSHVQAELRLLRLKYPVSIRTSSSSKVPGLSITVHVMLPTRESKVDLTFGVSPNVLHEWPMSVSSVSCTAQVVYGEIDLARFVQAARARIEQADENAFYGFLVDACREAALSAE